jgi:hypothetical protein
MKRKLMAFLLTIVMILGFLPVTAFAAEPPMQIGAPMNFGVSEYSGRYVYCTFSAPDDLRELMKQTIEERGYSMGIYAQIDIKVGDGNWHYTSQWDSGTDWRKHTISASNNLIGGEYDKFLGHCERFNLETLFPEDKAILPELNSANGWAWFKDHSITFRTRFAVDFGNGSIVFSNWTPDYVLSDEVVMDYKSIMANNAPKLLSSEIKKTDLNGKPYLILQLGKHPDEIQKLNAASGDNMWTEAWLRKLGDQEFKKIGASNFCNEKIRIDVGAYFPGSIQDYSAESYEVKVRYQMDMRAYKQSGITTYTDYFSPYSNILSYNMPAWSDASVWAATELQKAEDLGLIPDILNGADMTKNITREEFAEVALLMYQKASGMTDTTPAAPNPFTDLQNPQVLKAYKLGIVKGMSATTFEPKTLINREQVSAMLVRTIKLIAPDADYSTTGAPTFTDQEDISDWALNDSLYIAKLGIIKGSGGKFMPRAITQVQIAAGYANTSREQALAMSVRSVDKMNEINGGRP